MLSKIRHPGCTYWPQDRSILMIKKYNSIKLFLIGVLIFFGACKSETPENIIPFVTVYEELNLNDLRYQSLKQPNGYIYLDDLGYRGVVVLSEGNGSYKAYDRACPYHPNDDCAQVSVHSSGFYLEDTCCGSTFDATTGMPSRGPAKAPLRSYAAFTQNFYLIISSQ